MQSDQELEKSVRELLRNSRIDYSQVDVEVDAQNVRFRGTLENEEERRHLEDLARMIQDVGSITNEVTLKH